MSLIGDMMRSYRAPRGVMQAQVERGITEPQTLFYAMLFGMMNLIANYPRAAYNAPDPDTLAGMMAGLFIAYVFFLPLVLFGLAAIIHWVILRFGGQATWGQARRAMIWSTVTMIPFILVTGAAYIFQNSTLVSIVNVITAVVFTWQLWSNFKQVEFY
ncbi:MAG: YIP1 family protein [Amylibacter sp.]|nr:YIP1 family protein [Amylibacter sp.]